VGIYTSAVLVTRVDTAAVRMPARPARTQLTNRRPIPFRSPDRVRRSAGDNTALSPRLSLRRDVMIAARRLPVTWCWPAILVVVAVARRASMSELAGGEMPFLGHGVTSTEQGTSKSVNSAARCQHQARP